METKYTTIIIILLQTFAVLDSVTYLQIHAIVTYVILFTCDERALAKM